MTEKQARIVDQMIPWAVINPAWLLGDSEKQRKRNYDVYARMKAQGYVKTVTMKIGSQKIKRDILTEEGMQAYFATRDHEDPLHVLDSESLSIRNGKNTGTYRRWIRISDVQVFFLQAGIDSIYTAVRDLSENPFPLGEPSVGASDTVAEIGIRAMIDEVHQLERDGDLLDYHDERDLVLFLPKNCNPLSKQLDSSGHLMRKFNSSLGLLLDFVHCDAYVIVKDFDRKGLFWQTAAYDSILHEYRDTVSGVLKGHNLSKAMILCETPQEMINKASECRKISNQYAHVYMVLMKRQGVEMLQQLVSVGMEAYMAAKDAEIVAKVPGVRPFRAVTDTYRLMYRGELMMTGTVLDLRGLKDVIKEGSKIYLACYEHQMSMYQEIGVPADRLVVVPL